MTAVDGKVGIRVNVPSKERGRYNVEKEESKGRLRCDFEEEAQERPDYSVKSSRSRGSRLLVTIDRPHVRGISGSDFHVKAGPPSPFGSYARYI